MARDMHSLGESGHEVQNPLEPLDKSSSQSRRETRLPVQVLVAYIKCKRYECDKWLPLSSSSIAGMEWT